MKPLEAFQYLFNHKLPLTITFPFEEEKGHIIEGKGICCIEKIHGTSKVALGNFKPERLLYHLKRSRSFQANFDLKEESYFCAIEKLTVSASTIVIDIPVSLKSSMRKFSRVEPSLRSPVILHVYTLQYGTVSFRVRDITEHGLSFVAGSPLAVEDNFMCGLQIPADKGPFIFSNASVVYKIESSDTDKRTKKPAAIDKSILYGLALFPHSEDVKKIRLYMNNRELEIKRKIQKGSVL